MAARLAFIPVSNSRSRTNTIFCSFSGMASIARLSPEGAGPSWALCSTTVPPPSGRSVNRQTAEVVCAHCRTPLRVEDVTPRPGPGYPDKLLTRPDVRERFGLDAPADD